jgi:hypothetical protein
MLIKDESKFDLEKFIELITSRQLYKWPHSCEVGESHYARSDLESTLNEWCDTNCVYDSIILTRNSRLVAYFINGDDNIHFALAWR